ncbi:GNAT family N-acetyltransferase [Asanoa sp. NPDC049518]|uniref:GNAT family N-acetyltransferase n=1 Tax=unclassified Asanoa TaxID=2685164 RepID=UPI00343F7CE2
MAEPLVGRDAVLAAVGAHPYARLTTGDSNDINGVRVGSTVVWVTRGATTVCALGDGAMAAAAVPLVAAENTRWWHLPRVVGALPVEVEVRDEWDFRWTSAPPPRREGESHAARLDDDAAIAALLDVAFPSTTTRPGDPRVRAWWAIRDGAEVVACAADRSRGGVGFLSGIAVHPSARGRGFGAALTAALTRNLVKEFGIAALGVMTDNVPANTMYARLGYTSSLPRTSVGLA